MPRKYNIRWNENDLSEIKRLTRNFNDKIRRLEKKYKGEKVILPERVSVSDVVNLVQTRGDLQRELRSLQRFTQRGSEKLVSVPNSDNNMKITNWQRKDMQRRASKINRIRSQRKEDLDARELKRNQKPLGYRRSDIGMGTVDVNMLLPTNPFPKNMSVHEANLKMEHLRRESQNTYWRQRDVLLRNNFVETLKQNFNPERIKDITDHIMNMDIDKFMETFNEHPDDFSLGYPMTDDEEIAFSNELRSNWLPAK